MVETACGKKRLKAFLRTMILGKSRENSMESILNNGAARNKNGFNFAAVL